MLVTALAAVLDPEFVAGLAFAANDNFGQYGVCFGEFTHENNL